MSKITGYARQDEPKWFYLGLIVLVLFAGTLLYLGGKAVYRWAESGSAARLKAAEQKPAEIKIPEPAPQLKAALGGVTVERIVFTSELGEGNEPADDLSELGAGELATLYCWTRIKSEKLPQTVRHVWLRPDGKIAADITLQLGSRTVDTYSYKNMIGVAKGVWELQVRNERDEVIARKTFRVS